MDRCVYCRDSLGSNFTSLPNGKSKVCERCTELVRAPPCQTCGKPVREAVRGDPEPYHELCRRCKSCNQVIPKDDMVKLAGHLLCSSCEHLFGKFFVPKHRSQAQRMKEAFTAWDHDGSGSIEIAELRRVMKALDPDFADRDLAKLFNMIDINRSGVIEYEEFCDWIMKGMPLEIAEDGFERFVTDLMRQAGSAAQQAEMDIVEVQLRPDGLLFVRKCGDESFVTRALGSSTVKLARLDPEEFVLKVECTERGLILAMNTGRIAIVSGKGRLFGPWQAPEGFHIVGLRTKPADAAKGSPSAKGSPRLPDEVKQRAIRRSVTRSQTAPGLRHGGDSSPLNDQVARASADDFSVLRRAATKEKETFAPKTTGMPWLNEGEGDIVVGIDVAPLPGAKSYDPAAALRFAAEHDFLYTLQQLLAKAATDVNGFGPGGVTALMLASQHGNIGAMRLLLGCKASPNIQDPDGWTALTFASRCGQTTGVEILLDRGASLEGDEGTALKEAVRHQHNSAARALLRAGLLPMPKGTFALEDPLVKRDFKLKAPVIQPAGSVFSKPVTVEINPYSTPPESEDEDEPEEKAEDAEEDAERPAEGQEGDGQEEDAHPDEEQDDEGQGDSRSAQAKGGRKVKVVGKKDKKKRKRSARERDQRTRFNNEPPPHIYYTLDGRDPFAVGRLYKGPLTITDPRTHLRAVAVRGRERSLTTDEVYVVCHYAMPDDIVTGELTLHALPEAEDIISQALAKTVGEPRERVRVIVDEVEGREGGCWLRVPLCDPRPRHCLFIDRSFSAVRGNKLKEFIDKFRNDIQQAVGEAPDDIDVKPDLRAGRSAHKAGSIAVEFTLPRELAEEVKRQLDDPNSFLLTKAKHRSFLCDGVLEVVELLCDRLTDRGLQRQLHEALSKKAVIDDIVGFGSKQEGMLGFALHRNEVKKVKERGALQKAIQTVFPNTQLGEAKDGFNDGLVVEYSVDIISSKKDDRDGCQVAEDLNNDNFPARLMSALDELDLPLKAAVSERATTRQLSQVEFHLEWKFPELEDGKKKKDFLDSICMLYDCGTLLQVIDFRSAHEDRQVHDGKKTEGTASICRSIQRAVQHSGDIMSDTGGEHRMSLDLDALPPNVTDLFFVLAAFDSKDLSQFQDTCVEIHDVVLGRELTRYSLDDSVPSQAVVMCSFTKDPDHGKWVVHGMGFPSEGNSKDYEPIKSTIATRCHGDFSRWERRKDLVKLRVLHKCKRLTASSSNDLARFLWQLLDMPITTFQLVVLWL